MPLKYQSGTFVNEKPELNLVIDNFKGLEQFFNPKIGK